MYLNSSGSFIKETVLSLNFKLLLLLTGEIIILYNCSESEMLLIT